MILAWEMTGFNNPRGWKMRAISEAVVRIVITYFVAIELTVQTMTSFWESQYIFRVFNRGSSLLSRFLLIEQSGSPRSTNGEFDLGCPWFLEENQHQLINYLHKDLASKSWKQAGNLSSRHLSIDEDNKLLDKEMEIDQK